MQEVQVLLPIIATSPSPPLESDTVGPTAVAKNLRVDSRQAGGSSDFEKSAAVSSNTQAAVQNIEAAASVWSKWHRVAAYGYGRSEYGLFTSSAEEVVIRSFTPFVTSSFSAHSLTAAAPIFSSVVAGLSKPPLAKLLDLWGRPQGMTLCHDMGHRYHDDGGV
ncbi:hypothetical protein VTK56DRAFT_1302 [Thermocarpiscus australiensis]